MTGTAISLGVEGVNKPPSDPILSHGRMSPLQRNSLLHQGAHLHDELHLPDHEGGSCQNYRLDLGLEGVQARSSRAPFQHVLDVSLADARLEVHFHPDELLHAGAHLLQDNMPPLMHHEPKSKASLRVSERTWESRRIKEEMQGLLSPTPLELHKVSSHESLDGA